MDLLTDPDDHLSSRSYLYHQQQQAAAAAAYHQHYALYYQQQQTALAAAAVLTPGVTPLAASSPIPPTTYAHFGTPLPSPVPSSSLSTPTTVAPYLNSTQFVGVVRPRSEQRGVGE